jgi:hypothetical protein
MSQRRRDKRPVHFSPEDAAMNNWLVDESDYVSLARVRRPVELEPPVRRDVHQSERA